MKVIIWKELNVTLQFTIYGILNDSVKKENGVQNQETGVQNQKTGVQNQETGVQNQENQDSGWYISKQHFCTICSPMKP